jgi:hypothetical protein
LRSIGLRANAVLGVAAALIAKTIAVARARGVTLPADVEDVWIARLKRSPPGMYASMCYGIARDRAPEVDGLSGHVVRAGRPCTALPHPKLPGAAAASRIARGIAGGTEKRTAQRRRL